MATIEKVHLKIQALVDRLGNIPVAAVMQAFDNDPGIIGHIEKLAALSYIELNENKTVITITLHGFFINIPNIEN